MKLVLIGLFGGIWILLAVAADVPPAGAVSMGSAVGTGGALAWLLARTLPDREETMRELSRSHREGLRDVATAIDGLRDGVVTHLGEGNQRVIALLQEVARGNGVAGRQASELNEA